MQSGEQLDHAPEVFAVLQRRRLGLALAGDVDHDAEQLHRHAVDAVDVDVVAQPDGAAVGGDHAVDQLVVARGQRLVVAEASPRAGPRDGDARSRSPARSSQRSTG